MPALLQATRVPLALVTLGPLVFLKGSYLALSVIPALSMDLRVLQVSMAIPLIQQTPPSCPTISSFQSNKKMQI